MVGSTDTSAGRSIPGSVRSTKCAVAMRAPVSPALTAASASPLLTRSMATRIDESFLRLTAVAGDSSMATTSAACRTRTRGDPPPRRRSSASIASRRPTSTTVAAGCDSRKRNAPGTVTAGPWSPPIQSIARVTLLATIGPAPTDVGRPGRLLPCVRRNRTGAGTALLALALGLDDLLAAIEAARADVMPQVDFAGRGFDGKRRVGESVVRAVHPAL